MKRGSKLKRLFEIGLLVIILVSGVFCFKKLNLGYGVNSFEELQVQEIYSAIDNGESLIVYYGRESCSACRVFTPTLEEAAQIVGKKVYFLDGDNLETKGFSNEYNIQSTPTLLIIKNGKLLRYEGELTLDETIEVLKDEKERGVLYGEKVTE